MELNIKELLVKTIDKVKKAGKIISDNFYSKNKLNISEKGFANFVTEVDYAVQSYLIESLSSLVDGSSFLAEEGEEQKLEKEDKVWVLDPIDGTTNFIHKHPNVAISLAYIDQKKILFGIVYNPITQELYYGVKGEGAYLNDRKIQVSSTAKLKEALIGLGLPYDRSKTDVNFECAKRIYAECHDLRRSGSAALDLCFTACGRLDGYFELELKPWDILAGKLILEEAGGRISDWNNEDIRLFESSYNVLATNGVLHQELSEKVKL